ncbi:MAG: FMN-binding protein [Gammaproteobacteria bacterium]|nr:FMN-binding protein [Gammaproteobacteria bacterium]
MKAIATLTLLSFVAGCLLALLQLFTADRIEQNQRDAEKQILAGLVDSIDSEILREQGIELVNTEIRGYGGTMKIVVAFRGEEILGVRVLSHGETPGFSEVLKPNDWIGQFEKQSVHEVDAVTGATITTNAVIRAVKDSLRGREDSKP